MGPADVVVSGTRIIEDWSGDQIETLDESRPVYRVDLPDADEGLDEATCALAIEMVGTCQTIFDMTLEYAKQREQFGVPIGSFQAVKHKLVDMYVALNRARACAYFAAATVAENDPRRSLAVSMAKAAAGDAQRIIGQEGIQIHGGIGYTWEHDLHLFVKRAKTGDALFGGAADHRQRVARLIGL
jgi:alkylation response protein AidB-like acyl-CoA dehydrogenase